MSPLKWAIALACLHVAGCSDEPTLCTTELRMTPRGTITWSDDVVRVPDRVYAYYHGRATPVDCAFDPPTNAVEAVVYGCPEGPPGPATLRVFLQTRHWDTSFDVTGDDCHADHLILDVSLVP